MIKKLFIVFLFLFIFTPGAFAADEFTTSYDVTYEVGEDGVTTITEKISLKNLTSQYYANQFKITIGATQISDVKASDASGSLEVITEKQDNTTSISVKFNQQVAGLGKTFPWTLQFKSKDFAEKEGKVWQIRAPKVSSESNLESFNLTISVPLSFGEMTIISPQPKTQTVNFGKRFLTFDKGQLKDSGVSASFGSIQLFDFDLSYHLENPKLVPAITHIALPPDTAYQDVIFQRIEPTPINITLDADSNYLAWYKLERNQKLDIKVSGSAKLYTSSKVKEPQLGADLWRKYTQKDQYWEKDNPVIQEALADILGPNPPETTKEKARLIHRYLVKNLKYDSSRLNKDIERLGAVTALHNPEKAVCMEFTDLFIALSRAANIPSRELDGFAYSANTALRPLSLSKDILHAWPEYWDEAYGWVMIDPTWENTTGGVDYFNKLDLNHFVFAIKGSSSQVPAPAGSYKYEGIDSQDVKVILSDNDFLGKPQIEIEIEASETITSGLPSKLKVRITNNGNAIYPSNPFLVSATRLTILKSSKMDLGPIPAFGKAEYEFDLRAGSLLDSFDDEIIVKLDKQKLSKHIQIRPFFHLQNYPLVLFGIVGLMVTVYFVILATLIYRKRFLKLRNNPKK